MPGYKIRSNGCGLGLRPSGIEAIGGLLEKTGALLEKTMWVRNTARARKIDTCLKIDIGLNVSICDGGYCVNQLIIERLGEIKNNIFLDWFWCCLMATA